ncbi:response regulator [Paraburkholderia bryophila]|uniref:response regulator n=1 Tax=Paraburkholderia bryophila TaxID=420952 RepID=UPI0015CAA098|nr:response regulator [Paraburkholderia bryophila]
MYSILLVDDEPDVSTAWSLILESEGYDVRCAHNGRAALASLAEHLPHLVITDWTMPVMGGAELCRQMRLQPRLASLPIVVHSSVHALPDDALWNAFLRKPCSLELFLTTARQLCEDEQNARRIRLQLINSKRRQGG